MLRSEFSLDPSASMLDTDDVCVLVGPSGRNALAGGEKSPSLT